uniref:Ammonium transporter AmtB-like domain-containing protein n=1 Tax=Microcebus murinus TaxID=30608 RepID=A0A8C5VDC0_MICMU
MGSKYPPSLRVCLPWWALALEAAFILVFFFYTSYDTSSKNQKTLMETYRGFQDVTVMAALGMSFLASSLRRYSWSGVAFSLFLLVLGVQWALLVDGFLENVSTGKVVITLLRYRDLATMSAVSVLISLGAILGKANLLQLLVMVPLEVTAFSTMRMVNRRFLNVCFNQVLGVHDTCGVYYTFSLPGLLGGITYIVLLTLQISWTKNSMTGYQVLYSEALRMAVASNALCLVFSLVSGFLTGLFLNLKIWKRPHITKYFDDQAFWKFPHLAVGF